MKAPLSLCGFSFRVYLLLLLHSNTSRASWAAKAKTEKVLSRQPWWPLRLGGRAREGRRRRLASDPHVVHPWLSLSLSLPASTVVLCSSSIVYERKCWFLPTPAAAAAASTAASALCLACFLLSASMTEGRTSFLLSLYPHQLAVAVGGSPLDVLAS